MFGVRSESRNLSLELVHKDEKMRSRSKGEELRYIVLVLDM